MASRTAHKIIALAQKDSVETTDAIAEILARHGFEAIKAQEWGAGGFMPHDVDGWPARIKAARDELAKLQNVHGSRIRFVRD